MAIRDYIPADESLTREESSRFGKDQRVVGPTSRPNRDYVVQDFIPADGFHEGGEGRAATPAEAQALAFEAASRAVQDEARHIFEEARNRLRGNSAQGAVDLMSMMSPFDRDVHLIVEARDLKRRGVLEAFPAPDPATVRMFKKPRRRNRKTVAQKQAESAQKES